MSTARGIEIGLGLALGCFLLGLIAEITYLLWWRKRNIKSNKTELEEGEDDIEFNKNNTTKYAIHDLVSWWKKRDSKHPESQNSQELADVELGNNVLKAFGSEYQDMSVEAELMRLHNLSGPPRFLFTIKEETKEDLESEGGKSIKGSRTHSLSEFLLSVDTPLANSPHLTNSTPLESYQRHGFNPLFESSIETEINRLRSSPPPKFKFLRNAEEKLYRRLIEEAEQRAACKANALRPQNSDHEEKLEGSFMGLIKQHKERQVLHMNYHIPQYPSSSSQVLPLASSPSAVKVSNC